VPTGVWRSTGKSKEIRSKHRQEGTKANMRIRSKTAGEKKGKKERFRAYQNWGKLSPPSLSRSLPASSSRSRRPEEVLTCCGVILRLRDGLFFSSRGPPLFRRTWWDFLELSECLSDRSACFSRGEWEGEAWERAIVGRGVSGKSRDI